MVQATVSAGSCLALPLKNQEYGQLWLERRRPRGKTSVGEESSMVGEPRAFGPTIGMASMEKRRERGATSGTHRIRESETANVL